MFYRRFPLLSVYFIATSALIAVQCSAVIAVASEPPRSRVLSPTTIRKTIEKIASEMRNGYVFPQKGAQAAQVLEKAIADGTYTSTTDPAQFAHQLSDQLRIVTGDSHVRVIFGSPFHNKPPPGVPQDAGFDIKRLDGNIGYIHLARFVPPQAFIPAANKAMTKLSNTTSIIIDMRDNGGGHPASVAYLVSFFLDPNKHFHINDLIWRNRGTSTFRTESFWSSQTPVHYLNKRVYVLIGPKTYSAGEEFAYDLQVLKRAIVVGEKSRGGANPGGLIDLGSDLFVVVPPGRAENPITHSNWGGVGVHPDISVRANACKEAAIALAMGNRLPKSTR